MQNGKTTNHKHQISNKFQIQNFNDRNKWLKFKNRNLEFWSLDIICDLFFPA